MAASASETPSIWRLSPPASHNADLTAFAKRLRQAGKPAKVVLVAVMRKLIILANTLINQNRLWSPIAP